MLFVWPRWKKDLSGGMILGCGLYFSLFLTPFPRFMQKNKRPTMKKSSPTKPVSPPPFALAAMAVIIVILIVVIWKDNLRSFSLFSPRNQKARASFYYFDGKKLLLQGKYQHAKTKFQHALRLNPDYSQAHINLGVCYFKEGNYNEAVKSFKAALKKICNDTHYNIPIINHNLGAAYTEMGEIGLAWDYYMKAYKSDPSSFNKEKEQWLVAQLEQNNKEEFISKKRKKRVCELVAGDRGGIEKGDYDLTGEVSAPDPDPAYVGDKVSFIYVVKNLGNNTVPSGSFDVEFYVGGELVSFDRCAPSISNGPEGGVSYGRKKELSIKLKPKDFSHFVPERPGKYSYELVIDTHDRVKETNEDNNRISGEITVFDNPPLRLWAIGWNNNKPEVDINNTILKEGDLIAGYTVVKIDKGFVVLSKESRLSWLTFGGLVDEDQSVQSGPIQAFYDFYETLHKPGDFPFERYMSKRWLEQFRLLQYDLTKFLTEAFPERFALAGEKIEPGNTAVVIDQEFESAEPCKYVTEGGTMKPKYICVKRCTIKMVNEDGVWKIDSFGWRSW